MSSPAFVSIVIVVALMRAVAVLVVQVELLLTLEEYCSDEGVFEGSGESGAPFAAVFPKILEVSSSR